ncbi:MAG: hypothetical protein AAF236_00230 [Verrucomicrobiota bacterium]
MKHTQTFRWLASFWLGVFLVSISGAEEGAESIDIGSVNDAAYFLAGLPLPNDAEHELAQSSTWKGHCRELDEEFESHFERVLEPMHQWGQKEIAPDAAVGGVVRYLFSGPDMLHVDRFFPSADTYILCGLEPVGVVPTMEALEDVRVSTALYQVRNALGESLNFSFFRTKDMGSDLSSAKFRGTTPIALVFLARLGKQIESVEFFTLEEEGTLTSQGHKAKGATAVKLAYRSSEGEGDSQTMYYFSSDLSNSGFPELGFDAWLSKQGRGDAYLKAASFLMHGSWFSNVRDHLLQFSDQIVTDDSGIPFRYFDTEDWDRHLYGVYSGPIDLFSSHYQRDMRAAYREGSESLPFGTGYKWRKGESNLMRFVRKSPTEIAADLETESEE